MTCASLWRYYNVRVVQCIIIMASKIATALMCFYVWNSRNNKQKKKENSAYQGQRERWNEKIRHEPYAAIASSSPAQQQHHQPSTTTTSAKRQQLIKVQRQNGYDGKVFDAIQSLKNTRKRRWRWCVGFHLFLSAVQFSVCFNVQIVVVVVVVGIPLESVAPPCTSLCKFVLYPYGYNTKCFIVLDTNN